MTMSASVRQSALVRQAQTVDQRDPSRSTAVDHLDLVNKAVEKTGWSPTSLESAMDKDKAYVSRVLNGEKPLSLGFIQSLPADVEATYAALYAEAHGYIVVEPVSREVAIGNLVSGLMGVLAEAIAPKVDKLPTKADRMARGELPAAETRRTA